MKSRGVNLLTDVVTISEDADGHIDIEQLKQKLDTYKLRSLKIGSFSAASNVTGIISDTDAITRLLHENGALAFWDYAASAPYVEINVHPEDEECTKRCHFSLARISLLVDLELQGFLIVNRAIVHNSVPVVPGGGDSRICK